MDFIQLVNQLNIELSAKQLQQLETYANLLVEWNEKINLTAITDYNDIFIKHFYDCMLLLPYLKDGSSICDVGSGAGFPGLVLKITNPSLKLTLVEPTGKRCNFLNLVINTLNLKDIIVENQRSEDYVKLHREAFDYASARAVASLNILAELTLPLVKVGGHLLAMKGPKGNEELQLAAKAITTLGGTTNKVNEIMLPNDQKRVIIDILKEKPTPLKYPRQYGQIKKKPL